MSNEFALKEGMSTARLAQWLCEQEHQPLHMLITAMQVSHYSDEQIKAALARYVEAVFEQTGPAPL